jgi:hypothetical protein
MMTVADLLLHWRTENRKHVSIYPGEENIFHARRDAVAKVIAGLFSVRVLTEEEHDSLFKLIHTRDVESINLVETILETKDISHLHEEQIYRLKY